MVRCHARSFLSVITCVLLHVVGTGAARAQSADASEKATTFPPLPLSFAVAEVDGVPVADRAWLEDRVRFSNRIFGKHGIGFRIVRHVPLDARHARLETRRDRHALGAKMHDEVINCFVVASLRDVDDPSRYRRGVHWRPRGYPGKHLLILSKIGGEGVLTHELGHFFGNRQHSDVVGNVMSYKWGNREPFFDKAQARRIHRFTRRFLATGELLPADEIGPLP